VLEGLVVYDFTRALSGPWCTRMLADLGATVVKFEPPGGDPIRRAAVRYADGTSSFFNHLSAGKRSVEADLADTRVQEQILETITGVDVVVENFKPGTMARFGLSYSTLSERDPRLVMCSISGFGQEGPDARVAAYATAGEAAGGIAWLQRDEHGVPRFSATVSVDIGSGSYALSGILAALLQRERSGTGCHVDVSMLESALTFHGRVPHQIGAGLKQEELVLGDRDGVLLAHVAHRYFVLSFVNDDAWQRVAAVLARPDVAHDAAFATRQARTEHWHEITQFVQQWADRCTDAEQAVASLREGGLAAEVVRDVNGALAHPQLEYRQFLQRVGSHHDLTTSLPFRFSSNPVIPGAPPAALDEYGPEWRTSAPR